MEKEVSGCVPVVTNCPGVVEVVGIVFADETKVVTVVDGGCIVAVEN